MRIVVLTSGRLIYAAGLVLLLTLEFDAAIRAGACLVWLALARTELARIERGFESCRAIRLSAKAAVAVLSDDQEWQPATLQTGSLVLRNFAWLRLKAANGKNFVELLRGDARHSEQWRRLQVIWRHIGE